MLYALVGVGALGCAVAAVTSKRMLISAIWLALASALVALDMYLLGAPFIAVIELSVGAGLVTVLFVFAINLTGDEALPVANSRVQVACSDFDPSLQWYYRLFGIPAFITVPIQS